MTTTNSYNIVVVEDSSTMQRLIEIHLRDYNEHMNIEIFSTVKPAMAYIETNGDSVDLIISDVMLPGNVSGIDFLRSIRVDQRFFTIPFIIITANTDTTIKQQSLKLNCNGFLYKPFTLKQLHILLKKWLRTES